MSVSSDKINDAMARFLMSRYQRADDLHLFLFYALKPRFALIHAICLKKFSQQFNPTNPVIVLVLTSEIKSA